MQHYEYEINLYLDKELQAEKEPEMFQHLSVCDDCRKTFYNYKLVKEKSNQHFKNKYENIPSENSREFNPYKVISYISAAAAVILLFILFTNKPVPTYITKSKVRVDTVFVQKELPFTQNQIAQNNSLTPGTKELVQTSQQEYLRYVMSLRTEVFTNAVLIKSDNGSIQ